MQKRLDKHIKRVYICSNSRVKTLQGLFHSQPAPTAGTCRLAGGLQDIPASLPALTLPMCWTVSILAGREPEKNF